MANITGFGNIYAKPMLFHMNCSYRRPPIRFPILIACCLP